MWGFLAFAMLWMIAGTVFAGAVETETPITPAAAK